MSLSDDGSWRRGGNAARILEPEDQIHPKFRTLDPSSWKEPAFKAPKPQTFPWADVALNVPTFSA